MSETLRRAFPDRDAPLVSYGLPFAAALLQHGDAAFRSSRAYLICSGSLARRDGFLDGPRATLGSRLAGVRIGMRPHTHWSEILEIVRDARQCNADLLVTLGAGSLTDAAKIVSFALANDVSTHEELASLCPSSPDRRARIHPSAVPVVCIPTSLSGGEYSAFAGATNDRDGRKYSFSGAMNGPALVILDPQLALSTPSHVWLSTGVKAVDHCIETLCSLKSDPTADQGARQGLQRLIPGLLKAKQDAGSAGARLDCQLGVIDAMAAASRGVPLGASHGIAHMLGPAGVGHGETSCILLPAVCKYNSRRGANVERQNAVARVLWADPTARAIFEAENLTEEGADLGDLTDVVVRALGMPRTLRGVGIGEEKLDSIAEHSLHDRWVKTNPAPLDKAGVLQILRMVLG